MSIERGISAAAIYWTIITVCQKLLCTMSLICIPVSLVVVYSFYRWEKIGTEKIICPKSYLVVRDTFAIYHASFFCGFLGLSSCLYSSVFSFLIHVSPFIHVCHNSRERIRKKKKSQFQMRIYSQPLSVWL